VPAQGLAKRLRFNERYPEMFGDWRGLYNPSEMDWCTVLYVSHTQCRHQCKTDWSTSDRNHVVDFWLTADRRKTSSAMG
jgi:hypothetical protein